ncbi:catecholate siderophore receptor CirA [compost metagenome]
MTCLMKRRAALYLGATVAPLVMASAGPALAQSDPQPPISAVEDVVVVGQRLANRNAVAAKRNTDNISDVIASDDINTLPDFNVAEALGRVAGVTTILDEGEGRYVAIRGLSGDYNQTNIDGVGLEPVQGDVGLGSRASALEAVPAAAVGKIRVIKSATPDLDANAIGGHVEIETRGAFDGEFFVVSGAVGDYSIDEIRDDNNLSRRADMSFARVFGDSDQFGVVGSLSYNYRNSDEVKTIQDDYEWWDAGLTQRQLTPDEADGLMLHPRLHRWYVYSNERERIGGDVKFEYRPDDRLQTWLSLSMFNQTDDEVRDGFRIDKWANPSTISEDGGSVSLGRASVATNAYDIEKDFYSARLGAKYSVGASGELKFTTAYSNTSWSKEQFAAGFVTANSRPELGYSWSYQDRPISTLTMADTAYISNASNFGFDYLGDDLYELEQERFETKLDYAHNEDVVDGWGFKTGIKVRSTERDYDVTRLTKFNKPGGVGVFSLADVLADDTFAAPYSNLNFLFIDQQRYRTFLSENVSMFPVNAGSIATSSLVDDSHLSEDIYAAYGMAIYDRGPFRAVFGARYEHTDTQWRSVRSDDPSVVETYSSDYGNWAPSLNVKYDLTENLRLRAAVSQTIARPSYGQLVTNEEVDISGAEIFITRGNPDLNPRESLNIDVSAEYYMPRNAGLLSLGLFTKDIDNEIFRSRVEQWDVVVDGVQYDRAVYSQFLNANNAKVHGLEASFVKDSFDSLPAPFNNLGVSANYTLIDGEITVTMADGSVRTINQMMDQPEEMANLSLFYESETFSGRIGVNHTGRYLDTINVAWSGNDYYYDARTTIDMQARYALTDRVNVFVEAKNLTDETRLRLRGPRQNLLQEEMI